MENTEKAQSTAPAESDARPGPEGEAAAAATPATATEPERQDTAPTDPDDLELWEAKRAVDEEMRAMRGEPPAQGEQMAAASSDTTEPETATEKPEEPPAKPAPMVPHARFHEELMRSKALARQVDYLTGQIEALKAMQGQNTAAAAEGTPSKAAPPKDSIQEEIEANLAEIARAAERFDQGEITYAEVKKIEAAANDRIIELRARQVVGRIAPQPTRSVADEAIILAHVQQLEAKHPYAKALTPEQVQFLAARAKADLAAEGRPLGHGPAEDMRLQSRVAELSDFYGPRWGLQPANAQATPNEPKPTTRGQRPLSHQAQARLAKMDLAASLPPDPSSIGAATESATGITAESVLAMDEEQIAALPPAVRRRLMGFNTG